MLTMKYINDTARYDVSLNRISDHVIQLSGAFPVKTNGFYLSRAGKDDKWDYSGFTTVYREMEGCVQFSDDGSLYTAPPEPEPDPEPYTPTLEEVRKAKKEEIYAAYHADMAAGVEVELSTGIQQFPLSFEDREFLMGKQMELAASNEDVISYQDSNNHCMLLSREDMQEIITKALAYVNVKTTYRNNLCEWADQCDSKEEAGQIAYGADIPEEYQNEVYKRYLAQQEG